MILNRRAFVRIRRPLQLSSYACPVLLPHLLKRALAGATTSIVVVVCHVCVGGLEATKLGRIIECSVRQQLRQLGEAALADGMSSP
jgi:hypothetical protein